MRKTDTMGGTLSPPCAIRKDPAMNHTTSPETAELCPLCEEFCPHAGTVQSVLRQMPDQQELTRLSEVFKIFSDTSRLRIISALLSEEMCVCDLTESLGMTQSAVSHQLRLLRNAHLVKTRREGKSVFYSLDDDHVVSIISQGLAHIRHTQAD